MKIVSFRIFPYMSLLLWMGTLYPIHAALSDVPYKTTALLKNLCTRHYVQLNLDDLTGERRKGIFGMLNRNQWMHAESAPTMTSLGTGYRYHAYQKFYGLYAYGRWHNSQFANPYYSTSWQGGAGWKVGGEYASNFSQLTVSHFGLWRLPKVEFNNNFQWGYSVQYSPYFWKKMTPWGRLNPFVLIAQTKGDLVRNEEWVKTVDTGIGVRWELPQYFTIEGKAIWDQYLVKTTSISVKLHLYRPTSNALQQRSQVAPQTYDPNLKVSHFIPTAQHIEEQLYFSTWYAPETIDDDVDSWEDIEATLPPSLLYSFPSCNARLHAAVMNDNLCTFTSLISSQAVDINEQMDGVDGLTDVFMGGFTVLNRVARQLPYHTIEMTEMLLKMDAVDLNIPDEVGTTPLASIFSWLSWFDRSKDNLRSKALLLLLKAGADINTRDDFNNTPLESVQNINFDTDNLTRKRWTNHLIRAGAEMSDINEHPKYPEYLTYQNQLYTRIKAMLPHLENDTQVSRWLQDWPYLRYHYYIRSVPTVLKDANLDVEEYACFILLYDRLIEKHSLWDWKYAESREDLLKHRSKTVWHLNGINETFWEIFEKKERQRLEDALDETKHKITQRFIGKAINGFQTLKTNIANLPTELKNMIFKEICWSKVPRYARTRFEEIKAEKHYPKPSLTLEQRQAMDRLFCYKDDDGEDEDDSDSDSDSDSEE